MNRAPIDLLVAKPAPRAGARPDPNLSALISARIAGPAAVARSASSRHEGRSATCADLAFSWPGAGREPGSGGSVAVRPATKILACRRASWSQSVVCGSGWASIAPVVMMSAAVMSGRMVRSWRPRVRSCSRRFLSRPRTPTPCCRRRYACVQAAQQTCASLRPDAGSPPPPITAAQQKKFVANAQCMRKHGFPNFPDPTFGAAGQGIGFNAPPGVYSSQSAGLLLASRECANVGSPLPLRELTQAGRETAVAVSVDPRTVSPRQSERCQ